MSNPKKKNHKLHKSSIAKLLPTRNQLREIMEAIDFISHNSDGARDQKYYRKMMKALRVIWSKNWKLKHLVK